MTIEVISRIQVFILLIILAITAWTDLNFHRIPNVLSLGGIALAIVLHSWTAGGSGLLTSIGGAAVGMSIFLPFYLLHGMSAGDVKLIGTVGAFLGPHNAMLAAGFSLVAGGILALVILLTRGGLGDLVKRYWSTLKCFVYTHKFVHPPPSIGEVAAMKFPYASAIGTGTLVMLWWTNELQGLTDFLSTLIR